MLENMGNNKSTRKQKSEEKPLTADQLLGRGEENKRMMDSVRQTKIERDALNKVKSEHFLKTKPIWNEILKQTGKKLWYKKYDDSWIFDVGYLKSVDNSYMVILEKPEVNGVKPRDIKKPLWKLFTFNPKDPQTAWETRMGMFPVQPTLKF